MLHIGDLKHGLDKLAGRPQSGDEASTGAMKLHIADGTRCSGCSKRDGVGMKYEDGDKKRHIDDWKRYLDGLNVALSTVKCLLTTIYAE